ncbi:MAG: CaiB/BaiF CoA-transferase family protein [Desulfuromonadaceae bacterium]|nr:CaiB/BaiF CoA-transferase family protein [Desulfuromonadaceae bacterium]
MLSACRVVDCSDQLGWLAGRMLADLGATVIKIDPPGCRTEKPDWRAYNINKHPLPLNLDMEAGQSVLEIMLEHADVLIECAHPGSPLAAYFDPERVAARHPNLVHVSITPFGRTGPRAQWQASDIELMAAAGAMSLAGEPDGEPVRVSVPQSYSWAGAHGAVGALVALIGRTIIGRGQHVDVSAQMSVIPALAHAPTFVDLLGITPSRSGAFMTGRALDGAQFRTFWPCADGYLNFILYGGSAGLRSNEQLVAWMRDAEAPLEELATINWSTFAPTNLIQEEIDKLEAPIGNFFRGITMKNFLEEASRREMLGYPAYTVADIAVDPQLSKRDFWHDTTDPGGGKHRYCGAYVMVDGERPSLQSPKQMNSNMEHILAEFGLDPLLIGVLTNNAVEEEA